MPDRGIQATFPITIWDHIKAHWGEIVCGVAAFIAGILIIAGDLIPAFDPAPSIAALPDPEAWTIGAFLMVGSIIWCWSLIHDFGDDLNRLWRSQCIGMMLTALGWTGYAVAALLARVAWVMPWMLGGALATMGWGYLALTLLSQRRSTKIVRAARDSGGVLNVE